MISISKEKAKYFKEALIIFFGILICFLINESKYLLFHTIIESISVIISCSLMIIALTTKNLSENNRFTYLGIVFGFAGVLNFFHVITYSGAVIVTMGQDITLQLSVAERYYEVIGIGLILFFISKKSDYTKAEYNKFIYFNLFVISSILIYILKMKVFPLSYISGSELTSFKIICEFFIFFIWVVILIKLILNRREVLEKDYKNIVIAIIFKLISEILLNTYVDVFDFSGFLGHVTKGLAYYFIYKVLFYSLIYRPFEFFFGRIKLKTIEIENKNEELRRVNLKLEKSFMGYKRLIESLPDGIVLCRKEKIIYVNDKILKMLNIEEESSLMHKDIYLLFNKEYNDKLTQIISDSKDGEFSFEEEGKIFYNDISIDVSISALYENHERGENYSLFDIRDISNIKNNREMEEKLNQKKKEEEFKNELIANISHELRTPINIIYTAVQLENLYIENEDIKSIAKYNSTIKQNCLRLIRIVNNIIDITKIEGGFFDNSQEVINIVEQVESITLSIITYAEYKNIKVTFDTQVEDLYVYCDSNNIERIFLNLLANSVKYGVNCGNITVSISQSDNFAKIIIKDDGIGIPEEFKEKVFERFQRVDNTMSRNSEGSGIGLYLVKLLIEMEKGKVYLNSRENEGTEFSIYLPLLEEYEEVAVSSSKRENNNLIEKVHVEFSDIYK